MTGFVFYAFELLNTKRPEIAETEQKFGGFKSTEGISGSR